MYTFREIREALNSPKAGAHAAGFPFGVKVQEVLPAFKQGAGREAAEVIVKEADRAASEPLQPLTFSKFHLFEKEGTRLEYEQPYFDRRRRLAALVFATLLEETDRYLPVLEDLIWEMCGEFTWCVPAHLAVGVEAARKHVHQPEENVDLFAAETAHGLAETLYLLDGRLNPWIVDRVKTEVKRRIFRPLHEEPARFSWESSTHNWSAVCAGAVGMAVLLLEDNRERLAGVIDRLLGAMECYMEGFKEDGGCPEGIGYWLYGFGYYTYFAEMLEAYTSGGLRLLDSAKAKSIAAFPLAIALSDMSFVNYSDASGNSCTHTGLNSRLMKRYSLRPPYMETVTPFHQDAAYRFAHISRNLLWTDPDMLGRQTPAGEWELKDLQWVVSRQVSGRSMVAFSAKGGHNAEPHNHNDVGHFILHAGGESLLNDLGAGVYTREYFGPKRYTFIHNASRGHSVPVIDGMEQGEGAEHSAAVVEKQISEGRIRLTLDATAAYPVPHLNRYVRRFDWSVPEGEGAGKLELTDRFEFSRLPQKLEEAFISQTKPELEHGVVRWQGKQGLALLRYNPEAFSASVEVIETQAHRGEPITVYRVALAALQLAEVIEFKGHFEVSEQQ
jgi:hypothetical protein